MRRQIQTLCYMLAALSLLGGLADIAMQFYEGKEAIHWRIPIILIGFGVGLPLVIFPFHVPSMSDKTDYDENDLSSVYQGGTGFLSGIAGEGLGGGHGDDSGGYGGDSDGDTD